MPTRIPDRLAWAVELLSLAGDERVLEVGCGTGVAMEMACARLRGGQVTGIDRSAAAVAAAERRLAGEIAAGRARVVRAALADAPDTLAGETFARVLAVNVNVFWLDPALELTAVRRLLAPGGSLLLVYEPPSGAQVPRIAEACRRHLAAHGFRVDAVREETRGGAALLAVEVSVADG